MNSLINSAHFHTKFQSIDLESICWNAYKYGRLKWWHETHNVILLTVLFIFQFYANLYPRQKSSGSVPCAHVTLSLLPAWGRRAGMWSNSLHPPQTLEKTHGRAQYPLTAVALPAWNIETKHQNWINTWLRLNLGCVSYLAKHISNGRLTNR